MTGEHPELREAIGECLARADINAHGCISWEELADVLLAGPVGKLQAELAEAQAELAQLREGRACQFVIRSDEGTAYCSLAERPDPVRIRREAIGARAFDIAAKARPDSVPAYPLIDAWAAGYNHALDTVLAAGESAVTGEAT